MNFKFSITAIIITLLISVFSGCNFSDDNWNKEDSLMPYDLIPKPSEHILYTEYNTKSYCVAKINDMTVEDYETFIELCKEGGFDLNISYTDSIYIANNTDGYSISLSYDSVFSDCRISVYAPKEK